MPFVVRDDLYPIRVSLHFDELEKEHFRATLDHEARVLKDIVAHRRHHVSVYDMTGAKLVDPVLREGGGQWLKSVAPDMQAASYGTAFVVPNMFTRGLIQTLFWMQRYPIPKVLCKTFEEAATWCIETLENEGHPLPPPVQERGMQALIDLRDLGLQSRESVFWKPSTKSD